VCARACVCAAFVCCLASIKSHIKHTLWRVHQAALTWLTLHCVQLLQQGHGRKLRGQAPDSMSSVTMLLNLCGRSVQPTVEVRSADQADQLCQLRLVSYTSSHNATELWLEVCKRVEGCSAAPLPPGV